MVVEETSFVQPIMVQEDLAVKGSKKEVAPAMASKPMPEKIPDSYKFITESHVETEEKPRKSLSPPNRGRYQDSDTEEMYDVESNQAPELILSASPKNIEPTAVA